MLKGEQGNNSLKYIYIYICLYFESRTSVALCGQKGMKENICNVALLPEAVF